MKQIQDMQIDEKDFKRIEAIIQSMTKKERRDPSIVNAVEADVNALPMAAVPGYRM